MPYRSKFREQGLQSPNMTPFPRSQRVPGILPICPPPRQIPDHLKPPPTSTIPRKPVPSPKVSPPKAAFVRPAPQDAPKLLRRESQETRATQQRRLGLIPNEDLEQLVQCDDSISIRMATGSSTLPGVLALASQAQAANTSLKKYLNHHSSKQGNVARTTQRFEKRIEEAELLPYDFQQGRQCFDFIKRSFGDPKFVEIGEMIEKWLWEGVEEVRTVLEQERKVRGMETFWLLMPEKISRVWPVAEV